MINPSHAPDPVQVAEHKYESWQWRVAVPHAVAGDVAVHVNVQLDAELQYRTAPKQAVASVDEHVREQAPDPHV